MAATHSAIVIPIGQDSDNLVRRNETGKKNTVRESEDIHSIQFNIEDVVADRRLLSSSSTMDEQQVPVNERLGDTRERPIHENTDYAQRSKLSFRSNSDPVADLSFDERKRRRMLAVFHLWRSRTEMQQQRNHIIMNPERRHSSPIGVGPNINPPPARRPSNHNRLSAISSAMPFSVGLVLPPNMDEIITEKRLWQSLVMPFVIGCVIFFAAVWTHQISLALKSDTLVMVAVLAAAFIVMAAIAFWLASDQQLSGDSIEADDDLGEPSYHRGISLEDFEHNAHCQRHRDADWRRLARDSQSTSSWSEEGANKCYSISIIDCQPPDYYSAMRNSIPVKLLPSFEDINGRVHEEATSSADSRRRHDQEFILDACPPSYEELASHMLYKQLSQR